MVITGGGGLHLYFRHPGFEIRNSAGALGPGLDLRGDGGYIIAPPSLHASGNRYVWELSRHIDHLMVVDPPSWLMTNRRCQSACQVGAAPRRTSGPLGASAMNFAALAAGIIEGARDDQLFRLACYLRSRGYTRRQAANVVLDAASRCRPPFPASLAEQKVANAWRYQ
jgi:hypothetical protein